MSVLKNKDPSDFRSRTYTLARTNEGVSFVGKGDPMGFGAMAALRSKGKEIDARFMESHLNSSEGYEFANVGVSAAITATHERKEYAVVVAQQRPDFGDTVLKLVSGYKDDADVFPQSVGREVAEEFLVREKSGRVIPFRFEGLEGWAIDSRPFSRQLTYSDSPIVLRGRNVPLPVYLPGLDRVRDCEYFSSAWNLGMKYFAPLNTAQLIVPFRCDLPQGVSLEHTEDKRNAATGLLDTHVDSRGLVLLGLKDDRLTGLAYRLVEGVIEPGPNPDLITLSQSFVRPSAGNIVTKSNIAMKDYLRESDNK